MNTTTTPSSRHHFLDWLRILAFGLLVPYHVGMYYVTWGWHVKSAAASSTIEPLMLLTAPWRMGLLFLISGAATQFLLQRPGRFVRPRSRRLLWPLLFGMFVIVPPQAYYEVVTKLAYAGSYAEFMKLYVTGYHGFCHGTDCLSMPTWNHLWFLPYLWAYTMLGWMLWKLWPSCRDGFERLVGGIGNSGTVLLALALPLMAARLTLGFFPSTHNLTWDWYNHLQYFYLFLLGMLGAKSDVWTLMQRWRWPALAFAVLAWAVLLAYFSHYDKLEPPPVALYGQRLLWGALEWAAIVAACGHAKQCLDFDHAARRWLTPAIFCLYVFHQTVIVLLTRVLLPLALPPLAEGLLLIALTFSVCLAAYALLRHVPLLREFVGIAPPKTERTAASQNAAILHPSKT
ncbi:acyltransferase family protein [Burkholderiaceae bacterium UC74_6]